MFYLQKDKLHVETNGHACNGAIKMPSYNKETNLSNGLNCNLDVNGKFQSKYFDSNGRKATSITSASTNSTRQRVKHGQN